MPVATRPCCFLRLPPTAAEGSASRTSQLTLDEALGKEHLKALQERFDYWQIPPTGLTWHLVSEPLPPSGIDLARTDLADALARKVTFTRQEWAAFGISDLSVNHFVKTPSSYHAQGYFKPISPAEHGADTLATHIRRAPLLEWSRHRDFMNLCAKP